MVVGNALLDFTFLHSIRIPIQSMTKESKRYIVVKEGDTLPNLCEQEYGNADLYTRVAQYNHLNHYRDLKPGIEICFPPLAQLPHVSSESSANTQN